MESDTFISRKVFIQDFLRGYPDLTEDDVGWWYDRFMEHIYEYLNEDCKNRVHLPRIGVLFTGVVSPNPSSGKEERLRYRLSCKAFPKPLN